MADEPFFPVPESDLRYAGIELEIARINDRVDEILGEIARPLESRKDGETDA